MSPFGPKLSTVLCMGYSMEWCYVECVDVCVNGMCIMICVCGWVGGWVHMWGGGGGEGMFLTQLSSCWCGVGLVWSAVQILPPVRGKGGREGRREGGREGGREVRDGGQLHCM